MKFIIFLFFIFFNSEVFSETWAVLLNGGVDPQSAKLRYYHALKGTFGSLRARKVERHKIITLHTDGGAKGVDSAKWSFFGSWKNGPLIDTDSSLENDDVRDVRYAATAGNVKKAFDILSENMQDSDHLFIHVNDHGSLQGIALWGDDDLSPRDLKNQLSRLPHGVTVHIVTQICYGGKLLSVTDENTCVLSTTSEYGLNISGGKRDYFWEGFNETLAREDTSIVEAFEDGRENDPRAGINQYRTSLDYFLEKETVLRPNCQTVEHNLSMSSPFDQMKDKIAQLLKSIRSKYPTREVLDQHYLKGRIRDLRSRLISSRFKYSEYQRSYFKRTLGNLETQWNNASDKERHHLRPKLTRLRENLTREDVWQRGQIYNLDYRLKMTVKELEFIAYATPEQMKKYNAIRRCLEYKI